MTSKRLEELQARRHKLLERLKGITFNLNDGALFHELMAEGVHSCRILRKLLAHDCKVHPNTVSDWSNKKSLPPKIGRPYFIAALRKNLERIYIQNGGSIT